MQQAGQENYFYCDTDSLIVNECGLGNLENQIDENTLGSLKIEDVVNCVSIRGLKDYSTSTKTVVKGIRKNAIEKSYGVYEQEQWPSFRGLLRSGNVNTYTIKKITKVLNRKYTKGVVEANGWISPLLLGEPDEFDSRLF